MNIHYFHQFYAGPEAPGPAQPRKLVAYLAEKGHAVDIIACDFNAYNEQDEPPEDTLVGRGRVTVHRLKTPRGIRRSLKARLNSYGRFAWSAYRYAKSLDIPDVVMTSIQPLFGGYAACRHARRVKRPFLLEMRDLWPDALVVKGAISNWQAAPLQKMAGTLYEQADRIVSLTPGIKAELLKKGIPLNKIDLFPNGLEESIFNLPKETRPRIRNQYCWDNQFVAVYTGTHTEVTAIDVIVKAADLLKHRSDIRIDLFGSGQSKLKAVSLAESLGLKNIHFHDAVAKVDVPAILAGADAGIMTLFNSSLVHIYFENKLIDYMGSSMPIAAAMGGAQAAIIQSAQAGLAAPGRDAQGLADNIRALADDPEMATQMGQNGNRWVTANLRQPDIFGHYEASLCQLANGQIATHPVWDPFEEGMREEG